MKSILEKPKVILVIAHSLVVAVNRKLYEMLANDKRYQLHVIMPKAVLFFDKPIYPDPIDPSSKIEYHLLETSRKNVRLHYYKGLKSVLNTIQPEVIILDNDPISILALKVGLWAKKHKVKVVSISCENLPINIIDGLKRNGFGDIHNVIVKRVLALLTSKLLSVVLCINKDGKKIFEDLGFKNVALTPLGFDETVFFPNPQIADVTRNKLGVSNTMVIGYFGRIVYEKGVHLLLKALTNLLEYEWVLLLDRFGTYKTEYQKSIEQQIEDLGLRSRVIYFDATHSEIANYMNAADITVLPSISTIKWKEQYGRVIPESMGCGTLVAVSNSGALPELVGEYGLIFEEGNINSLSNILKMFLESPNSYKELSEKGHFYAKKYLSLSYQLTVLKEYL